MKDLQDFLTHGLQLGKLESELAQAVLDHSFQIEGLCAYSGRNLPHGQESAHRRWLEGLHEMQQNFVDMELRAAQMKVELKEFLEQMESKDIMPDWEHPHDRKRMSAEIRRFYGNAFGARPRTRDSILGSGNHKIPKLNDEVYHNMLVFPKGVIHMLKQKRVTRSDAEKHMLTRLATLWESDPDESTKVSERFGQNYCWVAVPKHLDGSKGYAVVRRFSKFWGGIRWRKEVWVRSKGVWTLDHGKKEA